MGLVWFGRHFEVTETCSCGTLFFVPLLLARASSSCRVLCTSLSPLLLLLLLRPRTTNSKYDLVVNPQKCKIRSVPEDPQGGADFRFLSLQPDTVLQLWKISWGLNFLYTVYSWPPVHNLTVCYKGLKNSCGERGSTLRAIQTLARHQLTLREHGYGVSVSSVVPVCVPALAARWY